MGILDQSRLLPVQTLIAAGSIPQIDSFRGNVDDSPDHACAVLRSGPMRNPVGVQGQCSGSSAGLWSPVGWLVQYPRLEPLLPLPVRLLPAEFLQRRVLQELERLVQPLSARD